MRRESPGLAGTFLPTARIRQGALTGRVVYVSAGHGFTWNASLNAWRTQRGNTNDIVEDLVSTETVAQFLIPMLLNAGAVVFPVREPDLQTEMVVVDNADPGYSEQGAPGVFSTSTLKGYAHPPRPMPSGTNPFELGTNRLMVASSSATASATFVPAIPADGYYNVYISYSAFSARVSDAHFVVKHAGGGAHFRVNQKQHGMTWVLLGRFYFRKGVDPERGAVQVLNDSAEQGNISLDAVRFGGGTGLIDRGGGTSRRPRFEESARYHAQFAGAPPDVYDARDTDHNDDVVTRSRFAAWEHPDGEDAVYVAWHTNAFNGAARGTDTYVYGPNQPGEPYNFTGVAGSDVLAQFVHNELINDIQKGWTEPTWRDRRIHSAYFGELNPDHNPEMPAILLEVAFHDNATDAAHLKEPLFRYLAARAISQGIIKYFADKAGVAPLLPPEPPPAVAALNKGGGVIEVRWRAPVPDAAGVAGQAATGYRVYSSPDGLAWDDGVDVAGTSHQVTLQLGQTRYFRVTSVNAGGESFPSDVVGARAAGAAPALVVNAFDRLEAAMARTEDLSAFALAQPLRIFVDRMNDGTYVRRHGDAIAYSSVGFDGANAAAVLAGDVSLSAYQLVDWFAGRGHPGGKGPSATEQQLLRAYVASERGLLFSGAHAASALANGTAADQAFLAEVLHASAGTSSGGLSVYAAADQFLSGVGTLTLDDGLQGTYATGVPDVVSPVGGFSIATYGSASSGAGVAHAGAGKVVTLAFPFETVVSANKRLVTMGRFLKFFGVIDNEPPVPDGGTDEPDGGEPLPLIHLAMLGEEQLAAQTGCGCSGALGLSPLLALVALVRLSRRRRNDGAR